MIPCVIFICEYIARETAIPMFPCFFIMPIFLSFIMGLLSPTQEKFDYVMAVIMPLSLFCCMFIAGFLDKDDLETMFNIDEAFETALQPFCLIEYCCMSFSTLLSSKI